MCGILGVVGNQVQPFSLLQHLAHRGQSGCGLVFLEKEKSRWSRQVSSQDVASLADYSSTTGTMALAHTRYPTQGSAVAPENLQPLIWDDVAFVFNGNVFSFEKEELWCQSQGYTFRSDGDTERLAISFIFRLKKLLANGIVFQKALKQTLVHLATSFDGAYSVIVSSPEWGMVAFRDPNGIRPLEWSRSESGEVFFASETVALPSSGKSSVDQGFVPAGGYVWVDQSGQVKTEQYTQALFAPCAFEYIYFAHPDSSINGVSVSKVRENLGVALGKAALKKWGDLNFRVVPVPKTSLLIAPFVAAQSPNWIYDDSLVKVVSMERSFIQPTPEARLATAWKKHAVSAPPDDRPLLVVDDSIVRGNALTVLLQKFKQKGVKEIYVASACPPVLYPDFYGIAMPTFEELVAYQRTESEIAQHIGADGLLYQTLTDLKKSILVDAPFSDVSMPYLDGVYLRGKIKKM